jgi:hypothetical protein
VLRWPQDTTTVWLLVALIFCAAALLSNWELARIGVLVLGILIAVATYRSGGGKLLEGWFGKDAARPVAYLIGIALIVLALWRLVEWSRVS